ncbi:isoleucyl-trna synthetase [Colletotrichum karsti]|uniref:Isoleucine--tRNA ligase, mitochondrial n=1 Tax=Colletotrichum karsti TaxID=1095194 RepID=A0A9P6HXR7_9PEZI|nr:isoleucyl-trna synthetase [Colletotrichum karsti]KAF9870246.1 isoleucyl-trna synthetase [Colletotrichum karsti]
MTSPRIVSRGDADEEIMSKSWASTLRLPKSTFPPRPLPQFRADYIRRCADDFYKWQSSNESRPGFTLHDGPPYANGSLHVGHALNKVLKDMISRVKVQQGYRVTYRPGWDCHGLPIELKAVGTSGGKDMSAVDIRKAARQLASTTVLEQMESFRSYGVMGDWDARWTTMDPDFEIRQLRLFQQMVRRGLIYRKNKPVYWSPSSRTALAEAELEYNENHVSTAAYVRYPIIDGPALNGFSGQLYAIIWTTTPWTLPANKAIAIHDDLEYAVIAVNGSAYLTAVTRLDAVKALFPDAEPEVIVSSIEGSELRGLKYHNRLQGFRSAPQPIIHGDFVSADSGTGLVHIAPGHGFEDYEACAELGIDAFAPIDDEGHFTSEAFPDAPEKLTQSSSILKGGSKAVLALIEDDVLQAAKYKHKYPYDWRTKQPVVMRSTAQWFADVDSIKDDAINALKDVKFVPASGRTRLESFVVGRSEWCISRQRAWGVPIPALYDANGDAMVTEESVDHIISVIQQRGIDAWFCDAPDEPAWVAPSLKGSYRRGTDTMDVWFDSGSSWTESKGQADVYLEGSDQHRGWFQSSLLSYVAAQRAESASASHEQPKSPFKTLITHGFTLDQAGKKMSKSLGNTITPTQIMDGTLLPPVKVKGKNKVPGAGPTYEALGPDALRLWAASSEYTRDVAIGQAVLKSVNTVLVKYRTIIKMLLGSMHESARTAPTTTLDHIALIQLKDVMEEVQKAYAAHEFHKGFSALNRWVATDLSAFYLEAMKDRLYCGDGGGVLEPIFHGLLRMLSPMTPLLVEEAWDHRPAWMQADDTLTHPLRTPYDHPLHNVSTNEASLRKDIPVLTSVNGAVKAGLERGRLAKVLGSSLQSSVVVTTHDRGVAGVLEKYARDLEAVFVVSSVELNGGLPAESEWRFDEPFEVNGARGTVSVLPPQDHKCPRCWRYVAPREEDLCGRCEDVVATQ